MNDFPEVVDEASAAALAIRLGLAELRDGHHVERDERGWVKRDAQLNQVGFRDVEWLLVASIRPSFHPHATLAVCSIITDNRPARVKGALEVANQGVGFGPFDVSSDQVHRLLEAWSSSVPEFLTPDRSVWVDGIGYRVAADSGRVHGAIRFSNPDRETAAFALADALRDIVGAAISAANSPVLTAYGADLETY